MPKTPSRLSKRSKHHRRKDAGETNVKKEGWSADDLGEQSTYEGTTEISQRLRRGDESVGDPDERDVAGAIPEKDTPHGRETSPQTAERSSAENQSEKRG